MFLKAGRRYGPSRDRCDALEPQADPMESSMSIGDTGEALELVEEETSFPGLCRICGGAVPPPSDPSSCTPSLCSEECLAKALIAYWAAHGAKAAVTLREGYARLEGLAGATQNEDPSAQRWATVAL